MTRRAQDHLHAFLRALGEAGVAVSPPKRADFLLAVAASPPEDVAGLYWRARLTLVTDREAFTTFDAIFDAFFRGGHLHVQEQQRPPADAEGETAAPNAGGEGELEPLEPRSGSGLHASPVDLSQHAPLPAHVRSGARPATRGRGHTRGRAAEDRRSPAAPRAPRTTA